MLHHLGSGIFRISPVRLNQKVTLTRAKDKRKGPVAQLQPQEDTSDAPPDIGMARLVYFWNRFGRQPNEPLETMELPWKEGEEPSWLDRICEPYETIVEPRKQIDRELVGDRYFKKAINKKKIKDLNLQLKLKLWRSLPRSRKQTPP